MASNIKLKKSGDQLVVEVAGSIDEEVKLSPDLLKGANTLIFDFTEVNSINSCGIREWIRWLMPHENTKIVYRNCPKIIVDQINMVEGFLPPAGRVDSFFVPYYSEESGEEKHILFTAGKEFSEQVINFPAAVVDSTNHPMEIDVIESKYFRFLQKKKSA